MLRILLVFLAIFSFGAPSALFAASVSAGIPASLIWFSKDSFVEGEQITIFAPLYNNSAYRFRGTLTLRDGDITIGAQSFILAPGNTSEIVAFPWKAIRGDHAFSVLVSEGEFIASDKTPVDLPISRGMTETVKRSVAPKPEMIAPPKATSTIAKDSDISGAETTQYLSTKIPASIRGDVLPVVGSVERFRVGQAARALDMKASLLSVLAPSEIPRTPSSEWGVFHDGAVNGNMVRSPWQYAKLFFALCYHFLTVNVYAFYIFCAYLLYQLVRLSLMIFG